MTDIPLEEQKNGGHAADPNNKVTAYGTGSTQSLTNNIGFIAEDDHSEDDSYGEEESSHLDEENNRQQSATRERDNSTGANLQKEVRRNDLNKKIIRSKSNALLFQSLR